MITKAKITPKLMDESVLVHQLKAKDESAFKYLVDTYHPQIINVCFGFVHTKADAEDIAQEVFIQAYKSIDGFNEKSKISTWLYKIAVNKSLNFLRSKKTKSILQFLGFGTENNIEERQADDEFNAEERTIKSENYKELQMTLSALPKSQRTALTLFYFEDLSYNQIAEVMDLSLVAVQSIIFRGKKSLSQKIIRD